MGEGGGLTVNPLNFITSLMLSRYCIILTQQFSFTRCNDFGKKERLDITSIFLELIALTIKFKGSVTAVVLRSTITINT